MIRKALICLFFGMFILSCDRNSITGRKQLNLFSEASLQQQALVEYQGFLRQNQAVSPSNSKAAEMVKRVGNKIANAIQSYYGKKGLANELQGYRWEFNLVNKNEINAWCMPGGKVVVYSGILPITKNETALAIVLGHEITHALAKHGNERMSQVFIAQGLQVAGDVFTRNDPQENQIFNNVFGPAASIGVLLPNSRKQEYEADHYGLIFAAMAGYDPREAIPFWERMAVAGGAKPPEFLATHPSDQNRIRKLNDHMEQALKYYQTK